MEFLVFTKIKVMKKMSIVILILMFTFRLTAPPTSCTFIEITEGINPYEKIWSAVCLVESDNDPYAVNYDEGAFGIAQIRDVRLKDYNHHTGEKVSRIACFDVLTSKRIFMHYASQFRPEDIKGICRSWNGQSKENKYYKRIKKTLLSN
jgi:hypothetical protein